MMKISSPFDLDRELIVVQAEVAGPARTSRARLVLDTGAAVTTLTPQVVERIGYSWRDGHKKARVHTAIGEEHGYWLRVAELTVLGVATPDFALTVFPLGHKDIEGLVGMNSGVGLPAWRKGPEAPGFADGGGDGVVVGREAGADEGGDGADGAVEGDAALVAAGES